MYSEQIKIYIPFPGVYNNVMNYSELGEENKELKLLMWGDKRQISSHFGVILFLIDYYCWNKGTRLI